ncbi:nascent polypeptide-associated complex protein [Candidatus Pacearchaeota archaeon]|nr:nascent polypeptide-associated complex protein [Candidatus Pacearchaeota archaeon]
MMGLGGLDPRKMQTLMKQMGIKQEEIEAERVIIEIADKKIIIEPANVQKILMQGQESWQITGDVREVEKEEGIRVEDIKMVSEKTGKSEKEAKKALEDTNGDIAEAIVKLSG